MIKGKSSSALLQTRVRVLSFFFWCIFFVFVWRMFSLMILSHEYYQTLSENMHETNKALLPERGSIFVRDRVSQDLLPVATNKDYYQVFADTRLFTSLDDGLRIVSLITSTLSVSEAGVQKMLRAVQIEQDPYELLVDKVEERDVKLLKDHQLPGLGFIRKTYRYYPEQRVFSHVLGFVGKTENGDEKGLYGVEGYWQDELKGSGGFLEGIRGAQGAMIPTAKRIFTPPVNGVDLVLTLDRAITQVACDRLRSGVEEYGAKSGALLIMDPRTGAIIAMCSVPDFNPNEYGKASSVTAYNNDTIFTAYEPGSIMKPFAMAAAVNESLVGPRTTFTDPGIRTDLCDTSITNADNKSYGVQTMTEVLQKSINTGMVFVAEKLGKQRIAEYYTAFGFGVKTGITMQTESSGNLARIQKKTKQFLDCYGATASFGQGITATPLQLATAYSVIANGGMLVSPYIVAEKKYPDGRKEDTKPVALHAVLTPVTAEIIKSMLISVVEFAYGGKGQVKGYYVAGKSGTAQIPGPGGYTDETNHSFVGFAPAENPRFVMIVKYEKPQRRFAESTAVPTFADVASFLLSYYEIPPTR